jgi:periplasmic divalent cation tolerance protein
MIRTMRRNAFKINGKEFEMKTPCLVVLCSVPTPEKGREIAKILVEARLCACVNIVAGMRSIYRWNAQIQNDPESLMILKTTPERYQDLEDRLQALHPYDVPEVLALPVYAGAQSYLDWVVSEVSPET